MAAMGLSLLYLDRYVELIRKWLGRVELLAGGIGQGGHITWTCTEDDFVDKFRRVENQLGLLLT